MQEKRNRRLRKKLYLGEFAIKGFEYSCDLDINSETDFDAFFERFLDVLEERKLCMGSGGDLTSLTGFICSELRYGSATEEDLIAMEAWLNAEAVVSNVVMGKLVDANYDE
ncbi:50S ribosome-binding protein YggL [Marinomonas sp. 15G1-11]|uniref:50S ribosome-binding protein YggL n=1 Tax=Marinomonas phaeophyticola TaxID=3004091 RepID=A0ABT4JWX9_9GAMM|nr:YggL family protein [Marinomonas sp. 15G1-11]MCZ2722788.1 50S ribosome-binding protein YggL [Marinomonas sp. 15G1-11]